MIPAAVLTLLTLLAVAAFIEWRDHRKGRHVASRGPYNAAPLVVDEHPDGDIVTGLPDDVRDYLLDACREADRGEPLPTNVLAFVRPGGAR